MSKVSQELKLLLYLNDKRKRTSPVSIKEIADYLEISDRQARRYIEDLSNDSNFNIVTYKGRNGGYRLNESLDFAVSDNLSLAMSIAMKRNTRIEYELKELSNYVVTDSILGDNTINNYVLDNLELIIKAIKEEKELGFNYKNISNTYRVEPYKVYYTNHTYYLYSIHEDRIKKFDVRYIKNINILGTFKIKDNKMKEILESFKRYGIKDNGVISVLKVKCTDINTLYDFDRYYESKGIMSIDSLTYTVEGVDNELYYPLFRISTKKYIFLDESFKNKYITYLKNQIKSIEVNN